MKYCFGCMERYEDTLNTCPFCGYAEGTVSDNALHLRPGTILQERYIVGKVIGYGGFGVTYIGWDAVLETKIAIKEYLPSDFATRVLGHTQLTVFSDNKNKQFNDGMKKFINEAKKLAKFHSTPGIVKIFDSFEANNTAYIVMELLQGETLAEKLKREKKIPEDDAIEMITPIIESLKVVHSDGIIHRDIAPDNIFVTNSGEVKLIDFGAARYATTSHSRSLTVIIKPGYSPEEQYRSKGDQGAHTDVYAVAATLYKMITGVTPPDALERRAFFENKQKDILEPITKYDKDISDNHETAILNALSVRIEDRTPDMQTFLDELNSEKPVTRRVGKIKKLDRLKWPLWAKIAIPSFAAAVAVFSTLLMTGVISFDAGLKTKVEIPEGQTRVPSVISKEYNEGADKLKASDLLVEISGLQPSDIPADLILYQDIEAGTVVEVNTLVSVLVSSELIKQPVPNVQGTEYEDAKEQLEELGFKVKVKKEYSDVIAENCIISQSVPPEKELPENSEVTLTISIGRDPSKEFHDKQLEVPDFSGMTFEEAYAKASSLGMLIKVTDYRYSKEVEKNRIIESDPAAGELIMNRMSVELVISLGYAKVSVPKLELMEEAQAVSQLKSRGLKANIRYEYSDRIKEGLVISQDPKEKTEIEPESTVNLVVSKGTEASEMPDVTGLRRDNAEEILKQNGLVVTTSYKTDDSKTIDTVLSQDPAKGEKVHRGDKVEIVICTHETTVTLTDLTGLTRANAEKQLKNKGLKVNVIEVESSSANAGKVISQLPASGTKLKKNETVTINIGKHTSTQDTGNVQGGNTGETQSPRDTTMQTARKTTKETERQTTKQTTRSTTKATEKQTSSKVYIVEFDENYSSAPVSAYEYHAGDTISYPEDPERSGYKFMGWSTSPTSNSPLRSTTVNSDITLYAQWKITDDLSDWVLPSEVPANATVKDKKWEYTIKEIIEDSDQPYIEGYTKTSEKTIRTETNNHGVRSYAVFPDGFDTSDRLYAGYYNGNIYHPGYGKEPLIAYENDTEGLTVYNTYTEKYIYWHWCCPQNDLLGDDKVNMAHYSNEYISGIGNATKFEAFTSFEKQTFNEEKGAYEIYGKSDYSNFWVAERIQVIEQDYQYYTCEKKYTHEREVKQVSYDPVTVGGNITSVTEWVRYKMN